MRVDSGQTWVDGGRVPCGGRHDTADCFAYSPGLQTATGVRYIGNAVPFPLGAPPWTDYVNSHATEYRLAPNGSAVSVNRIARPVRFLGGSLTTHGGCNLVWNRTVSGGIGFQGHGVTQLPGGQGWLLLAGACIGNVSRPDGPLRGADALSLVAFRSTDDGWTWRYTATVADIEEYTWSYYGPGGGENALAVLADRKTVIAVARWDGNGGKWKRWLASGVHSSAKIVRTGCDTIIPDGSPQDPHDGHGPTTISHYANYYQSYSRDSGSTWTPMRKMPAMGCVRPRLLMLSPAGPLVLSGGRACNRPKSVGDRGVLLWVNADGMGGASPPSLSDDGTDANSTWQRISVTEQHNKLWEGDKSYTFPTPAVSDAALFVSSFLVLMVPHSCRSTRKPTRAWCQPARTRRS